MPVFKRQRLIIGLIIIFIVNIFLVNQVWAFDSPSSRLDNLASKQDIRIKTNKSLPETVGRAVKYVVGFVGIIFLILILYAGFLWMTAGGSQEEVTKARAILKWSLIGVIVVLGAYAVTNYIVENMQRITSPNYNPYIPDIPIEGGEDDILGYDCSQIYCQDCMGDKTCCENNDGHADCCDWKGNWCLDK